MHITKYHLYEQRWGQFYSFPNTLFGSMFPNVECIIVSVAPPENDPDAEPWPPETVRQEMLALEMGQYRPDHASTSKKNGELIWTDAPIASRFGMTPQQALAYGSIWWTSCHSLPPVQFKLNVLVVNDGEYGTGDCHGSIATHLAAEFDWPENRAGQFRLGVPDLGFLAKGTLISPAPLDGVDMILPVSCFKSGYKPLPGYHEWDAHFGVTAWSRVLPHKVSWSVLQWLTIDTVEREWLPYGNDIADVLVTATSDTRALTRLMHLDDLDETEIPLVDVIAADKNGYLSQHPHVVHRAATMLRQRWLHLARGAGHKMTGLMAMPDDSLPLGFVASNELPVGPVLAVRYPVRYWGDCLRPWRNVHTDKPTKGVVWMSHATAALLGGDFDGDYFCFVDSRRYPLTHREVVTWADRGEPDLVKDKTRLASEWSDEALVDAWIPQTMNLTGQISYLIARAAAYHLWDTVLILAEQLQISVDMFKYDLELDHSMLTLLDESLPELVWTTHHKRSDVYLTRPLPTHDDDTQDQGTIAWLINHFNAHWVAPETMSRPLVEFAPLLPGSRLRAQEIAQRNRQYGAILAEGTEDDKRRLFIELEEWVNSIDEPFPYLCAAWQAAHKKTSLGRGSFGFLFSDALCTFLGGLQLQPAGEVIVTGIQWNDCAHMTFAGAPEYVAFRQYVYNGKLRLGAYLLRTEGDLFMGPVSMETPMEPMTTAHCHLTTVGKVVRCRLSAS